MKRLKIFISCDNHEFESTQKYLIDYLREDTMLGVFFEVLLIEEVMGNPFSISSSRLNYLSASDIYLALIGNEYGVENASGISTTENEFRSAKLKSIPTWIFIKGYTNEHRHPKQVDFISKIGVDASQNLFSSLEELKKLVYNACVHLLKLSGKIVFQKFDECFNNNATVADIDADKFSRFLKMARLKNSSSFPESSEMDEVLNQLMIWRKSQITNVEILAFGKQPQRFFPSAKIKCVFFHGVAVETPIPEHIELGGTIFEMAEGAVNFVMSKIRLHQDPYLLDLVKNEHINIPRSVIEEVIFNAVAHRDYYSSASIQVSVFLDRVEVFNPGFFPDEFNKLDLKSLHLACSYNPALVSLMNHAGFINGLGSGISLMMKQALDAGLNMPQFIVKQGIKVVLWRYHFAEDIASLSIHDGIQDVIHDEMHDEAKSDVHEHFQDKILVAIESLPHRLVYLLEGEMSRDELMSALGLKSRDNFQKTYLQPAVEEGVLTYTLPDKKTSKRQKYKLTKKGKLLQKKLKERLA